MRHYFAPQFQAVFKSVDHGNKGHVTKDELKEGLHKASVDLGDEWQDTNIDECLQHLHGSSDDKVGLREFVVMLAVGRVCRPLKGVSKREEGEPCCCFPAPDRRSDRSSHPFFSSVTKHHSSRAA